MTAVSGRRVVSRRGVGGVAGVYSADLDSIDYIVDGQTLSLPYKDKDRHNKLLKQGVVVEVPSSAVDCQPVLNIYAHMTYRLIQSRFAYR